VETDDAALAVEALAYGRTWWTRPCSAAPCTSWRRDAATRRTWCASLQRAVIGRRTDARSQPSLEDVFVSLVRREGGAVEG
jgi:hypothetical protein